MKAMAWANLGWALRTGSWIILKVRHKHSNLTDEDE
jgi:hypothetical protein